MSTYTSLHYHIIFATRARIACLDQKWRNSLFEYIGGTIRGLGAFPQGVGGWIDHIHILMGMKADQNLAHMVREIKKASSVWVKQSTSVKNFAWQEGYGAFTVGYRERAGVKLYIAEQEAHHGTITFTEEIRAFYDEAGIPYDSKYLP